MVLSSVHCDHTTVSLCGNLYCMYLWQQSKEGIFLYGCDVMCRDKWLIFYSLAVSVHTTRLNIQTFYMVLALRWVFCTDLRTDSGLCCIRHQLIGFYNHGGKCLLRGTDWFLTQSRSRFVFKTLTTFQRNLTKYWYLCHKYMASHPTDTVFAVTTVKLAERGCICDLRRRFLN